MKEIKINIIFNFHENPWGGGNQFLKALKKQLMKRGNYEEDPKRADCFIFNSHQYIKKVLELKMKNQDKIFIHRIDGPTYLTKISKPRLDFLIYNLNKYIADGTIFQSKWSEKENYLYGFKRTNLIKIVNNAPDNDIFYPLKNKAIKDGKNEKCVLITSSWSKNFNKGFKLYKYLDENLNFDEYSMIFVGNSPFSFKNIKHIPPVNSYEMAKLLRQSDIYLTGAMNEACSNSLLEALNCGLPCVTIHSGSNPELIKRAGELFHTYDECIEKINKIKNNYHFYKNNILILKLEDVVNQYFLSIEKIFYSSKYTPKRLRYFDYYKILINYNILKPLTLKILLNKCYKFILTVIDKIIRKVK